MDLKEIKQILKLMDTHGLSEFRLEKEDEKLVLRRNSNENVQQQIIHSPHPAVSIPFAAPQAVAESPAAPVEAIKEESGFETIESPMVGTFYSSASPDSEPYVQVGDSIGTDTTVCIVEAMKIMNEIKAEINGTIEQICVQNGQPVEFGQALFKIKPV